MRCPKCGCDESKVVDSRPSESNDAIRRRRECIKCGTRFTTYERREEMPILVVKKDGSKETFERQKLMRGLVTATVKRNVTLEDLNNLIDDIESYNQSEGLALSPAEIEYLKSIEEKLGRKLTDSEVFGFSQVNSEHCRHKIFGGEFIIDGVKKESSLFSLIKKTSKENPNDLVSAYTDNVAFKTGPVIEQFAPASGDKPDFFEVKNIESVISLKAETHNFPTTVEPFNGAATGTGGEIRDRLGGGKASLPIAGTAVYMTS